MTDEFCDCGLPMVLDQDTVRTPGQVRFHCPGEYCDRETFVTEQRAIERMGRDTFQEVA